MNSKVREILYASSILPVLALCLLSGQGNSPFRFIFFPLIVVLAFRITQATLLKTGFTYGMLFALISFAHKPPDSEIPTRVAELLSIFLVTAATGFALREKEAERGRSAKASAAFQVASEELQQKSQELKTSLDALSKAHQQLLANSHSKSRFLANVSHELRTPLTSIRSYSEILRDYDDIDDATRKEFIHTIYDESERMTLLVNKYLDLLRMGSGKSEMILSAVNSRLLVEVAIKVVAPMAEKKGIPIGVDLPADLPPVKGDQNLLTQVLVNILGNAVKFTASGQITAGTRLKDGVAEFYVADTGEGIFPEEKEVIFDEFYRISGALPDRPAGSGLGLAIARQIVEQHGGTIWVDSTPGKGSTFYFTVPIYTEEAAIAEPEPFHGKAETALPSEPILVLSESIVIRQTLRKFLENLGYRTVGADTLKRGGEVTAEIRPGLIVTDNLQGSGDFQNLGNWARDAGIKIILVTLYVNPGSGDLGVAASGYLKKPFDRYQIISSIEPFVKESGRLFIISPAREEARNLQMLLGGEGYAVELFMDETEAVKAAAVARPDGVVLGSFPRGKMEDAMVVLKKEPHCRAVPFFLLLDEECVRFADVVTIDRGVGRDGGKGLIPLIKMVEKSFAGR